MSVCHFRQEKFDKKSSLSGERGIEFGASKPFEESMRHGTMASSPLICPVNSTRSKCQLQALGGNKAKFVGLSYSQPVGSIRNAIMHEHGVK
jgi:hypothetical protein